MASSSPEELLKTAEKRANASGGFFSFGSSSAKYEEAAELFKAAANKFRASNRFDEAGHAFMKAAETEIKGGEVDYAANTFFEASKCFKMTRPERESRWRGAGNRSNRNILGRIVGTHRPLSSLAPSPLALTLTMSLPHVRSRRHITDALQTDSHRPGPLQASG